MGRITGPRVVPAPFARVCRAVGPFFFHLMGRAVQRARRPIHPWPLAPHGPPPHAAHHNGGREADWARRAMAV